jgi:acyl-CoA thioester hydrolase
MNEPGIHRLAVRVYYEDTDASGLVYHARYLHFLERARTEMLRQGGMDHVQLMAGNGLAFAVRNLAIEFRRPARLDDLLEVETRVLGDSGARIEMSQRVVKDGVEMARARLTLACMTRAGRPLRLPADLRARLAAFRSREPAEGVNGSA